jgi:hypothetical protein
MMLMFVCRTSHTVALTVNIRIQMAGDDAKVPRGGDTLTNGWTVD